MAAVGSHIPHSGTNTNSLTVLNILDAMPPTPDFMEAKLRTMSYKYQMADWK